MRIKQILVVLFSLVSLSVLAVQKPYNMISGDANIIGGLNVNELSKLDSVSNLIKEANSNPIAKAMQIKGFTLSDIKSVAFGLKLNEADTNTLPPFIAIFDMKSAFNIDSAITEAKAKDKDTKFTSQNYKGLKIYSITQIQDGKPVTAYVTDLGNKLIGLGTQDYIKKSIDLKKANSSGALNKEMQGFLSNKATSSMFWVGAKLKKLSDALNSGNKEQGGMPSVDSAVLGVNKIGKGIQITGSIDCASQNDASKLYGISNLFVGALAMNPDNHIQPNDIKFTSKGKSINVDITLPQKFIDDMTKQQEKALSNEQATQKPNTN